ncbi:protein regulator of cytokinesis 1-like [Tribolium madens]|uniref:protein regulator of cytokinesis 1-like n=1 Tax=Tribolium madens TaxID=41895 RepID=UPI001CF72A95|nr:protein regulator of cytokinesis 1-like [Tribolium madens]
MCDVKRQLSKMNEFDEEIFKGKPWAEKLLADSISSTKRAVSNWCDIVCKIGEADLDLDQYVKIFIHQIENLYEDLIADMDTIQEKTYDQIMKSLQKLEDLCRDLHLQIPTFNYEGIPLCELHRQISLKVEEYEVLAQIRRRELSELSQKQVKLCASLGRAPRPLEESPLPLPSQLEDFRAYVEGLETEALEREEIFFQLKEKIVEIVTELDVCPNLEFEKDLLNLTNTQVMITDAEMAQLREFHDQLVTRLSSVKEEIGELRSKIDDLWKKLEIDMVERDIFLQNNTGHSLKTLDALKIELNRLEEMKKANLRNFIEKQRAELVELWDKCHCTQEQRDVFTFYHSECFNEDLFELHDREIEKWKRYYEEHIDIFTLLEEFKQLWAEHLELEMNSGGANRYKNRGGLLLLEEKNRNKLKKQLPLVEESLRNLAQVHYLRIGQEFYTFGQTIPDYIQQLHQDKEKEFKQKLSAKKQQREQQSHRMVTPTSLTPRHCSKRKVPGTTMTEPPKKAKISVKKEVCKTGLPKLNISKTRNRRKSARRERLRQRLSFNRSSDKENQNVGEVSTSYHDFEKEISGKEGWRSTTFGVKVTNPEGISIKNEKFLVPGELPKTPRPKNTSRF